MVERAQKSGNQCGRSVVLILLVNKWRGCLRSMGSNRECKCAERRRRRLGLRRPIEIRCAPVWHLPSGSLFRCSCRSAPLIAPSVHGRPQAPAVVLYAGTSSATRPRTRRRVQRWPQVLKTNDFERRRTRRRRCGRPRTPPGLATADTSDAEAACLKPFTSVVAVFT